MQIFYAVAVKIKREKGGRIDLLMKSLRVCEISKRETVIAEKCIFFSAG